MDKISNIIIFTTCYLVFYTVGSQLGVLPEVLLLILFAGSPFLVIYMAIRILRNGEAPEITFEDGFWYEDKPQVESARSV
jgi:hypothetical protein